MSARGLSDGAILALASVAIAALAGAAFAISPAPAVGDETGSSYSARSNGAKAAFLTLKQLGYRIDRSFEPVASLTIEPATAVLVLASPSGAPSDQDRKALLRFVERGGVVLATGVGGADFLGGLNQGGSRRASSRLGPPPPEPYAPAIPSALSAGAPEIRMTREGDRPRFDDRYLPIYGPGKDSVVQAARIGQGHAIWWAGSTPLSNQALSEPGHLELLLNAIGRAPARVVLWDEQYHGHARSLWSYAAATPLPWAALQLALVAVAALATFSRRRRPIRPRVVDPRTSPMEFVDTMGGLYQQSGAASAAVAAARTRLRRLLVAASGLPPDSEDAAVARASAARLGLNADRVDALLASSAGGGSDEPESLSLVRGLQNMSAMVRSTRPVTRGR